MTSLLVVMFLITAVSGTHKHDRCEKFDNWLFEVIFFLTGILQLLCLLLLVMLAGLMPIVFYKVLKRRGYLLHKVCFVQYFSRMILDYIKKKPKENGKTNRDC